jgi:hypothetical protein
MKRIGFLIHDHAMAGASAATNIVAPCLRDEEKREAFNLFYEAIKATLLSYEEQVSRMRRRIEPSEN